MLIATLTLLSVYISVLIVALVLIMFYVGPEETQTTKVRAASLTILACATILWPVVWYISIGRIVMRYTGLLVLFGAIWPQAMLTIDMTSLKSIKQFSKTNLVGNVQDDANSLIGVAFAFAMMMLATYASAKKEMYSSLMMVLFALVICIAFVVPQPLATKDGDRAFVGALTQRAIFAYAMGFLISALCVVITVGAKFVQ